MTKKYQVFISSTYLDLQEQRKQVIGILLTADCIPSGMEAFTATDDEQFNVIKKVIDLCDYYILIIGNRYGSVNEETGLSYTEMEYSYAKQKGIPILVFAINPHDQTVETKYLDKLQKFRSAAMGNRLVSLWKDSSELVGQVAIAIMNAKENSPRPGWQRATDYDETSLLKNIVDLQKENDSLKTQIEALEKSLDSIQDNPDLAFEDGEFEVIVKSHKFGTKKMYEEKLNLNLKELFGFISRVFLNVSVTESTIESTISDYIKSIGEYYSLSDKQITKKVLLQYSALKLVKSNWSESKNRLYWSLTKKGELVRDEMNLLKKTT